MRVLSERELTMAVGGYTVADAIRLVSQTAVVATLAATLAAVATLAET